MKKIIIAVLNLEFDFVTLWPIDEVAVPEKEYLVLTKPIEVEFEELYSNEVQRLKASVEASKEAIRYLEEKLLEETEPGYMKRLQSRKNNMEEVLRDNEEALISAKTSLGAGL